MKPTYEQERVGEFIRTYTGGKFYILDPKPEDINITDIAHSLSNLGRFTGHAPRFYSVGEHSLGCLEIAEMMGGTTLQCLYALLHDASESVMNDLARPIKQVLPSYKELEYKVMDVMWDSLGLPHPTKEDYNFVKKIDNSMVIMEMRTLMKDEYPEGNNLESLLEVMPFHFNLEESFASSNNEIRDMFVEKYSDLMFSYKMQLAKENEKTEEDKKIFGAFLDEEEQEDN